MTERVTITLELNQDVAWQLAQFCKRSTFDMFYDMTEQHLKPEERNERAYKMIAGIDRVAAALSEAGVAPR